MGRLLGGKSTLLLFLKPVSSTDWQQRGANSSSQSQALPNKRLKLAGGDRSKGSRVFVRWRAQTHVNYSSAGERVARSLSAIR